MHRERDVGWGRRSFLQRGRGDLAQAGHASGSGENPVRADEIGALANALSRELHRLIVVASDELSAVGVVHNHRRGERGRADLQPQRAS